MGSVSHHDRQRRIFGRGILSPPLRNARISGGWATASMLLMVCVLLMSFAGCAGAPETTDSSLGSSRISILDGDRESRRFTLYRRQSDGAWFQGGGKDAFEGMAPRPMEMTEADRTSILDALRQAGWLDGEVDVGTGTGPRYIEVSMSGSGVMNQKFSMLATDGGFDSETERVLAVLRDVAGRRFRGVLEALPKGRPSESSQAQP